MMEVRKTTPLRTILQNCLTHIENLEATRSVCDYYEKEFQDLKKFSENLKTQKEYACTEGEKEANRKKNRYKDILPFNVSRVILAEVNGAIGSNYVNANYIKGASGSKAYIASQGPLPSTVNDFWRMVVECEVQVIIMACNAQEAGKYKCENYWVEREGEERVFGDMEIRLLKANIICPDFLVRTMRLKYINDKGLPEERTVCQFHYSAWPDHGVPPLVRPLLDMVRLVRDTQASETLPVLVHCSAGCGRTGTICAIDFVWGLLRLGKLTSDFSLFNLVRDMRQQRVAMVQTKEQYMLVHHAVRELFKEQLQIIDSHHYENLDPNCEPIYETISSYNSENTQENRDGNKTVIQEMSRMEFSRNNAPPLPKKKCPNISTSKQEKEVVNLTEKNRTAGSLKTFNYSEAFPDNSLSRKPKIAKLKALFERGTSSTEKNSTKAKSHTISRSHSLGPVYKPLLTETFKPPDVNPVKTELPIRSGGKLKVPKLVGNSSGTMRPVPQIKRSKSLKITKETTPLMTLLQFASSDDLLDPAPSSRSGPPSQKNETSNPTVHRPVQPSRGHTQHSIRRRSLESLMGEEPHDITWSSAVTEKRAERETVKPKNSLSLKHQLQLLSNASQRTMNSLASGLGIRERRNSFRQAVSKDDNLDRVGTQFGTEGRFISVPEDSNVCVFVDGSAKPLKETLTVRSQNGEILKPSLQNSQSLSYQVLRKSQQRRDVETSKTVNQLPSNGKETRISSQSMRLPSKNRFLYRLKTELEHNGHRHDIACGGTMDTSKYLYKGSPKSDGELDVTDSPVRSHLSASRSQSHYYTTTRIVKSEPRKESSAKLPLTRTRVSHDPEYINDTRTPKTISRNLLNRSKPSTNPYKNAEDLFSPYASKHSNHGPQFIRIGKSSSASSQSSDNLSDHAKRSPLLIGGQRPDVSRLKPDVSSESSSSSGARELHTVMRRQPVHPASNTGSADQSLSFKSDGWSVISRSKSTSKVLEQMKWKDPVAPPRIRRRSSVRHSANDLPDQIHNNSAPADSQHWRNSLGVDLDAVAASMVQSKDYNPNTSAGRRKVLSDKDLTISPVSSTAHGIVGTVRKQQYL